MLGALFYVRELSIETVPQAVRETFLARIIRDGFCGLAVHRAGYQLFPEKQARQVRQKLQGAMLHAMRHEKAFMELLGQFEEQKIRFIPIKGIDLAYRIYPSPSLRPFGDWDIFLHPDDFSRATSFLVDQGWRDLLTQNKEDNHHSSPLVKEPFVLEPHWTLSCFAHTSPYDIWERSVAVHGSRYYHVLTPELNILLVARHASEEQYRFTNITKMLLDAAFILQREPIDWKRVREVSWEMKQPYPGNLFAAFPEFFPEEMVTAMEASAEQVEAYRAIFQTNAVFARRSSADIMMLSERRFTWSWLRQSLQVLWPRNMRHKYRLPEGEPGKLARAYLQECTAKTCKLIRGLLHRDIQLSDYLQTIKRAEKM